MDVEKRQLKRETHQTAKRSCADWPNFLKPASLNNMPYFKPLCEVYVLLGNTIVTQTMISICKTFFIK